MFCYCVNPIFHGREKLAAVFLENVQQSKTFTSKLSKFTFAKWSPLVKCCENSTLYQAQEIKLLSQKANPSKAVQKFMYIINCTTHAKRTIIWVCLPLWPSLIEGLHTDFKQQSTEMQECITAPNQRQAPCLTDAQEWDEQRDRATLSLVLCGVRFLRN